MKKTFLSIVVCLLFVSGSMVLLRGKAETKKNGSLIHLEREEERLEEELEKLRSKLTTGEGTESIREKIRENEERLQIIEQKKRRMGK